MEKLAAQSEKLAAQTREEKYAILAQAAWYFVNWIWKVFRSDKDRSHVFLLQQVQHYKKNDGSLQ